MSFTGLEQNMMRDTDHPSDGRSKELEAEGSEGCDPGQTHRRTHDGWVERVAWIAESPLLSSTGDQCLRPELFSQLLRGET